MAFLFRFHVVASKGNLDCLNTILIHGVDITATDAAGMLPQMLKCNLLKFSASCLLWSGIKLSCRVGLPPSSGAACGWQKEKKSLKKGKLWLNQEKIGHALPYTSMSAPDMQQNLSLAHITDFFKKTLLYG